MNESILNALLQLFAIIANVSKDGVSFFMISDDDFQNINCIRDPLWKTIFTIAIILLSIVSIILCVIVFIKIKKYLKIKIKIKKLRGEKVGQ